MGTQVSQLANGFRVVSDHMPDRGTTALGIWVGSGARHEALHEHGISHLLEHMAFKGTPSRSAKEIAEAIERVGGDLNAATELETTAYYARVMEGDVALAIDVLTDILRNSVFDEDELALEKDVIAQEIASSNDVPDEIAFDVLNDLAFPEQSVGRPIRGTPESVSGFSSSQLRAFIGEHYRPEQMVLSVAGGLDHDVLVRLAEDAFGDLPSGDETAVAASRYAGGQRAAAPGFEQAHVVFGFEGKPVHDPDHTAAVMFSSLLGSGMSSRLFQEVREKRGLCYSIYSFAWAISDVGMFGVHAATGQEQVQELNEVAMREALDLAQQGPSDDELRRIKAQMSVGLHTGYESSAARAENNAWHLLNLGRLRSKEERLERIAAVSAEDIRRVGSALLAGSSPSYAEVGTRGGEETMSRYAQLEGLLHAG